MAKRFIDTGFYKSPFVRGLKGALKGLYSFIICDCDGGGIWVKDLAIASTYIGFQVTEKDFEIFISSGKAIDLQNGKYFFPDFIEHQYPQGLQEKNPAHKNFISELRKFNLIDADLKPLRSSFEGAKVMVMVKAEVKERVMVMPFEGDNFIEMWKMWKEYKKKEFKFTYKSEITEQAALNSLAELSGGQEGVAIEIIKQSMANTWKGFFGLKNNNNGQSHQQLPANGTKLGTSAARIAALKNW